MVYTDVRVHTYIYGSTVYIRRDGNGWFCIITMHKEISVFTFNFNSVCLLRISRLSSKDIKVENK